MEQATETHLPAVPAPASAADAMAPTADEEIGVEELPERVAMFRGPPTGRPQWPQECTDADRGLMWSEQLGRVCWDLPEGVPAPHVRRSEGVMPVMPLTAGRMIDIRMWALQKAPLGTRATNANDALRTLTAWLSARPHIRDAVYAVSVETPPGIDFPVGWWVRLALAGQAPGAASEVAEGMRRSYHGTALATLGRIVANGIRTGFATNVDGGQTLQGIWSLAPERSRLLLSYCLYTALNRSGYVYAPVVELRSPATDPKQRRVTMRRGSAARKRDQWISYEDTTTQVCIWIHALHVSEIAAAPQSTFFSIFAEGCMPPGVELSPTAPWSAILDNSLAAAQRA